MHRSEPPGGEIALQAVVFDVGYTLVDESRHWRLWAEWLKISEETFLAALLETIERGEHHLRAFERLQPGFVMERAREQRLQAGIPDEFVASDLHADVTGCFETLRKHGLRLGISGNQPASQAFGLPVDLVASSAQWGVEKPSREFFQRIVEELKLPSGAIAYVGDRLDNDILPALESGMTAVFIRRGPWAVAHARRPEIARAHLRIENLGELPAALGAIRRFPAAVRRIP